MDEIVSMTKSKFIVLASIVVGGLLALIASTPAFAQSVNFDLGQGPTTSAKLVQIVLLITVLSLAPSILVMVTSFTRIVVVLSFLRTALGTATAPPNSVIISLALLLTAFVMGPVLTKAYNV